MAMHRFDGDLNLLEVIRGDGCAKLGNRLLKVAPCGKCGVTPLLVLKTKSYSESE